MSLIIEGYQERLIHDYRNTRLLMYMMAKMWGDPKKVPDSPEALWRLPGDADTGVTEADIAEMFRKLRSKEQGG